MAQPRMTLDMSDSGTMSAAIAFMLGRQRLQQERELAEQTREAEDFSKALEAVQALKGDPRKVEQKIPLLDALAQSFKGNKRAAPMFQMLKGNPGALEYGSKESMAEQASAERSGVAASALEGGIRPPIQPTAPLEEAAPSPQNTAGLLFSDKTRRGMGIKQIQDLGKREGKLITTEQANKELETRQMVPPLELVQAAPKVIAELMKTPEGAEAAITYIKFAFGEEMVTPGMQGASMIQTLATMNKLPFEQRQALGAQFLEMHGNSPSAVQIAKALVLGSTVEQTQQFLMTAAGKAAEGVLDPNPEVAARSRRELDVASRVIVQYGSPAKAQELATADAAQKAQEAHWLDQRRLTTAQVQHLAEAVRSSKADDGTKIIKAMNDTLEKGLGIPTALLTSQMKATQQELDEILKARINLPVKFMADVKGMEVERLSLDLRQKAAEKRQAREYEEATFLTEQSAIAYAESLKALKKHTGVGMEESARASEILHKSLKSIRLNTKAEQGVTAARAKGVSFEEISKEIDTGTDDPDLQAAERAALARRQRVEQDAAAEQEKAQAAAAAKAKAEAPRQIPPEDLQRAAKAQSPKSSLWPTP